MSPSGDTTDSNRDLRLVDDIVEPASGAAEAPVGDPTVAGAEPAQASPPAEAASSSYFTWLLLGLTLLFAWLWLTQVEKANVLAGELVGVQGELAAATANIVAWEEHSVNIQTGVEGIVSQLGSLQKLLAAAPTSGTGFASDATPAAETELEAAPLE